MPLNRSAEALRHPNSGVIAALCTSRDGSSLRDLNQLLPLFPALKRWAKLGRPCGAGVLPLLTHCPVPLKRRSSTVMPAVCLPFMVGRHTIFLEVTLFRLSFAKNIFLDL